MALRFNNQSFLIMGTKAYLDINLNHTFSDEASNVSYIALDLLSVALGYTCVLLFSLFPNYFKEPQCTRETIHLIKLKYRF